MNDQKKLLGFVGKQVGRGMLMGGADIVPGVSGGTVALVLGIYERLVTAISHFDLRLLRMLRQGKWLRAALHVDLPFLIPLGAGILGGFVIMTTLMNHLLTTEKTRSLTLAAFFGLILASGILVARMISDKHTWQRVRSVALGIGGALFAFWITTLSAKLDGDPSLLYVFLAGTIAICAMILPGISGAMILLILGVYIHLTEIPGNLVRGQHVSEGVATVAVFACGCAVGLISFSKVLRWLLTRHHSATMAILCGFMFGSLGKLWPFQRDLTPHIEKVKYKDFQPFLPSAIDTHVVSVLFVMVIAVGFVMAVDWTTRSHRAKTAK
jgi:putative membrane protein